MAPKKKSSAPAASGSSLQSAIYGMLDSDLEKPKKKKMGPARCEAAWQRLTNAVIFLMVTTRQQMVLDYLQQKGMVHDEPDVRDKKTAAKSKAKKTTAEHIPQGIGQPLSRSSTQNHWELEIHQCPHAAEQLRCRSNRYQKWWTCLMCGARWERLETEARGSTELEAPEVPESSSLKTRLGSYPAHLPAPRSKPDQGTIPLKVDHRGRAQPAHGDTGSTQSSMPKYFRPKSQRERSVSKERKMTGLRPAQPSRRVQVYNLEQEPQEYVEDADPNEVMVLSSESERLGEEF